MAREHLTVFLMIPFASKEVAREALNDTGYMGTIVPATDRLIRLYEVSANKEDL